jgi:hypothetical protein
MTRWSTSYAAETGSNLGLLAVLDRLGMAQYGMNHAKSTA